MFSLFKIRINNPRPKGLHIVNQGIAQKYRTNIIKYLKNNPKISYYACIAKLCELVTNRISEHGITKLQINNTRIIEIEIAKKTIRLIDGSTTSRICYSSNGDTINEDQIELIKKFME